MRALAHATGDLEERTLDATYPLWHDGLSRIAYSRWFAAQRATPWGRRHLTRWALVDDGALLATAKLYIFDASLDRKAIRIAGLGAVFTLPDHRGGGVARDLIDRLLDHARQAGADAALLFSEIDPAYYSRLGFVAIPMHDHAISVREDTRRGAPATLVRAGTDVDLDAIVAMDRDRAAPSRFHLERDRDLAHYAIAKPRLLAGLSPPGARELLFFVAEEGNAAVAYVVIGVKGGAWTVQSCGDRDPSGARIAAILQVLVAREPAERRPAITAWLPPALRPPQMEIVSAVPSRDVMMIRPLTAAARGAEALREEDVTYWKGDSF
jgi:predicted N-acetyltransferase YhbS